VEVVVRSGAQWFDAVNIVKSGESGEEHLCAEARR